MSFHRTDPPSARAHLGPRRGAGAALARLALALLASAAAGGCLPVRPFAEVRAVVPPADYLSVAGQLVHVHQDGSGEPVLLVHGFGASSYSYRLVQPHLARSFHTAAVDLNGFGFTQRPASPQAYTREGQVALLLGVMDALGWQSAHVIGHSYGGALALWLTAEHPDRVRSLVLVDSAAPTYPDDRRRRGVGLRPVAGMVVRGALTERNVRHALEGSFHDDSKVTPELVTAYTDRLRIEGVTTAYRGLTAPAPRAPEFPWSQVAPQVLVVWGEQDELVRVEVGREATMRLPRAEFVVLPETGHMPTEESPEAFLAIVEPFLRRVSVRD